MSPALATNLDALPIPAALLDADSRVIGMNEAMARAAGVERDRAVDQPMGAVMPWLRTDGLRSGDREGSTRSHTEEVTSPAGESWRLHVTPAGEGVSLVLVPLNRAAPEPQAADLRDTLDRERRLYATVLGNTPDFAYVWSLDYRFLYANESLLRLYGLTAEQCIGRGFREVGYPDWHATMHEREIDEVARSRQPLRGKIPFYGKGGGGIYDYIFVPVIGPDGTVEAVGGITRDVSELERTLQALRTADRRKDEFLATLAHELRNPLAPMRAGLHLLRNAPTGREAEHALASMDRQIEHMVHLVDDLLDLSRVSRGAITLRREPRDLRDILHHAITIAQATFAERRVALRTSFPGVPMPVSGDETRLAQIFNNLLSNAAKYTPAGGTVTLRAERVDDALQVEVTDSGSGIREEDLERVFEMFSQVESAGSYPSGLGIGLHLVRRLVELHDGRVWARSPGLGHGSTFTVVLPSSEGAPVAPASTPVAPPFQARRVLIVDDNVDAAFMLSLVLKKLGHDVHATYGAREALDLARSFMPEAIVLDIGMPELDGYEACRLLRQMDGVRNAYIIALTGWGQEADQRKAKEAGFDAHLTKPADPHELNRLLCTMPVRLEVESPGAG